MPYPRRLIEVDLPIKRISLQAKREKDMRRCHVPLIHIWPATRPPAACRAVILASLWPDPVDENCPTKFVDELKMILTELITDKIALFSEESYRGAIKVQRNIKLLDNPHVQRDLLLNIIADFSNFDNSTSIDFIKIVRKITSIATISLYGEENPTLTDPFSGGGAIPLEGLRIGAVSFAADLNPISFILNKLILEYLPLYKDSLIASVEKYWIEIQSRVEKEISPLYHNLNKKETIVSFIWARTIRCEGPKCGVEIPLIRSSLIAKKGQRSVALNIISHGPGIELKYDLIKGREALKSVKGTTNRSKATCPACGFTHNPESIRTQLIKKNGGAKDSRMLVVVSISKEDRGRSYRIATEDDFNIYQKSKEYLNHNKDLLKFIPGNVLHIMSGVFNAPIYGHNKWSDLFNYRQLVFLSSTVKHLFEVKNEIKNEFDSKKYVAIITALSLLFDKLLDMNSALCVWQSHAEIPAHVFGRWALPMIWDYAESNPLAGSSGSFESTFKRTSDGLENLVKADYKPGTVARQTATESLLPDDSVDMYFTDPPYYNAIPYADISDFFYCWQRFILNDIFPDSFNLDESPKKEEICEMAGWDNVRYPEKDKSFFEKEMTKAFSEGRRILKPNGIGVVVFAHKETSSWEALVQAIIDSNFMITASWPLDTEMQSRLRAKNSAALASSVHLVCRPRENEDGSLIQNKIGDWRDLQEELPKRIHEWMPRLAEEGVAGADAIFACIGPALEIFSRYTRVEKPDGNIVNLREYLEKVWASVSQEALNMVFSGGEASSFEEDARLTAMWLWTLTAGVNDTGNADENGEIDEEESSGSGKLTGGYVLEYDTARKIAQGLGANLEELKTLVEVRGDKARLLPVLERADKLFGATGIQPQAIKKKKKVQLTLSFDNTEAEENLKYEIPELNMDQAGKTVLDRLHQALLLFSSGRTEALKRFLVEDGAGKDDRFWKLAQALTSLYPKDTDERRWVEAVQTYKKNLGF